MRTTLVFTTCSPEPPRPLSPHKTPRLAAGWHALTPRAGEHAVEWHVQHGRGFGIPHEGSGALALSRFPSR
jgi:hypothetical protein